MKTFMSQPKGPHQPDMKSYAIANPTLAFSRRRRP